MQFYKHERGLLTFYILVTEMHNYLCDIHFSSHFRRCTIHYWHLYIYFKKNWYLYMVETIIYKRIKWKLHFIWLINYLYNYMWFFHYQNIIFLILNMFYCLCIWCHF